MWKTSDPSHVVQMIPIDKHGQIMLMHRSDKVRSAPNCWSFPSGLHDIGETVERCAARELFEEFNLQARKSFQLGTYENMPGDGYHWVILVMLVLVETFDTLINNEPDKHDLMELIDQRELREDDFFTRYPFHPSFVEAAPVLFERVDKCFLPR